MFMDGQQAVPALIAGELDISFMTANASLFNSNRARRAACCHS